MYERATDSTILVQHNRRLCTVCVYFGKLGKLSFCNICLICFQNFLRCLLFLVFFSRLASLSSSVKSPSRCVILSSLSSLKSNGFKESSRSSSRMAVLRCNLHYLVSIKRYMKHHVLYYFQLSYMYDWPRACLQMNEVSPYDIYMYKRNLHINFCEHTHVSYNLKQPTSCRL